MNIIKRAVVVGLIATPLNIWLEPPWYAVLSICVLVSFLVGTAER